MGTMPLFGDSTVPHEKGKKMPEGKHAEPQSDVEGSNTDDAPSDDCIKAQDNSIGRKKYMLYLEPQSTSGLLRGLKRSTLQRQQQLVVQSVLDAALEVNIPAASGDDATALPNDDAAFLMSMEELISFFSLFNMCCVSSPTLCMAASDDCAAPSDDDAAPSDDDVALSDRAQNIIRQHLGFMNTNTLPNLDGLSSLLLLANYLFKS
ncbi:uncharacterized protein [Thunnus thynnus]|uniref:uncharacterized protein isoform X2 n=1 Tax=Thunnus thynnus TaxID=8237 RepID=UPI003529559E